MEFITTRLSPVNLYYLLVSIIAFGAMALDKRRSMTRNWRISEKLLLLLALLGGALGTLAGMLVFRHKTRKPLFYVGVPLIYLFHRALVMPVLIRLLIEAGLAW